MSRTEKRSLRILWVVDSLEAAAQTTQIASLVEVAASTSIQIDLLTLARGESNGRLESRLRSRMTQIHRLGALGPKDPWAFNRIRGIVREGRYDLLHAHSPWASVWGGLTGRMMGVPVLATLYTDPTNSEESGRSARQHRWALKVLKRWARRVIVLSGSRWDACVRASAFPSALLEVVYQGVNVPPTAAGDPKDQAWLRAKGDFPTGAPVTVTLVSAEEEESGVDVLLWAIPLVLAAAPQARFVIAGDGAGSQELRRRTRARGLGGVVYVADANDDLARILAGSELAVEPALRNPRLHQVLTAMAAGLPVVGTRVGGIPEIVGSTDVGRLVPRGDRDALAKATVELLQNPRALQSMGAAARARVVQEFSAERWASRLEEVYVEVVNESLAARRRLANYARLNIQLLNTPGALPGGSPRAIPAARARVR